MRLAAWQVASLGAAAVGTGVAGYLTYVHYNERALVCAVGNCHAVQTSRYAVVAGVPVALLGLGLYLGLLALGLARWRWPARAAMATVAGFALALAGALYAAYLTYLEIAVINAICQWCVVSALLTLGLLVAEGVGVGRLIVGEPDRDGAGMPAERRSGTLVNRAQR